MAIVEQVDYPDFRWGDDLMVRIDGGRLLVSGRRAWRRIDESSRRSSDIMREYVKAPTNWSKKHSGKDAPHIRFANADTDQKLISFVKEFGPVVVCALNDNPKRSRSVGTQDVVELRRERTLYMAALELIAFLSTGRDAQDKRPLEHIRTIVVNTREWPDQWERERNLIGKKGIEPRWTFTKRNLAWIESCADDATWIPSAEDGFTTIFHHTVICTLINAFPINVYRFRDTTIEGPSPDLKYGIRPLLYYFLRRVYLERNSVSVCANERCRQLFETERAGQRFCSADCSRQQRQREYWADRGKEQRHDRKERERVLGKNLG
jgi:hypothetical protein